MARIFAIIALILVVVVGVVILVSRSDGPAVSSPSSSAPGGSLKDFTVPR